MDTFFKWLSQVDTLVGMFTFLLVSAFWIMNWRKHLGAHQDVAVLLIYEGQHKSLPLHLRRKDVARDEVLGRIGMIPKKGDKKERFFLSYLSNPEFLQKLNQIQDGILDVLEIPCSEEEYNQFEL